MNLLSLPGSHRMYGRLCSQVLSNCHPGHIPVSPCEFHFQDMVGSLTHNLLLPLASTPVLAGQTQHHRTLGLRQIGMGGRMKVQEIRRMLLPLAIQRPHGILTRNIDKGKIGAYFWQDFGH